MGLLSRLAGAVGFKTDEGGARTERQKTGDRGEMLAASYLKSRGYMVLTRNFRTKHGEIDIVAFRDGVVAFVEVRTVTAPARVDPRYSVGGRKRERVLRAAQRYRRVHGLDHEDDVTTRFDVLTVRLSPGDGDHQVDHLPNAFRP